MKISIVVPVYNGSKHVKRCIDSILSQSFCDFELLLINDGSTDNSLEILKEYEKNDKRIKVFDQVNMGVACSRNRGIKFSKGEFITFIDNDDYIDNNYLESLVKNCNDQDIVISGYRRVNINDKEIMHLNLKKTEWAKYTFITPWARIFRREFLINNKIEFFSSPIGEDIYFNLKAYSLTNKIKIISYIGYNWFYNDYSISNTIHKGFNKKVDIIAFLNKILGLRKYGNEEYIDYYCYKFGIWYLLYSGRGSNKDKFIAEYKKIRKWNIEKNIKMNICPFSNKLNGESFFHRSIVFIFCCLTKLNLVGFFAKIYCKG